MTERTVTLQPYERALIACWARACWTDLAWSLRSKNVVKPEMMGGTIPAEFLEVLDSEWNQGWEATKAGGIMAKHLAPDGDEWGKKKRYDFPFLFVVSWRLVRAWLDRAWPHEARKRIRELHDEFMALHGRREDEEYHPWLTRDQMKERSDLFAARMAAGDAARMKAIRAEVEELINAQLGTGDAVPIGGQLELFGGAS